jgi:hypothetical protein
MHLPELRRMRNGDPNAIQHKFQWHRAVVF